EFQMERGGQWTKGKSADTFGPIGPWVVTADEVSDPGKLSLWTEVNGRRVQNSKTADLIFGIDHIVSYRSEFLTFLTCAIIAAGRYHRAEHPLRRGREHETPAIFEPRGSGAPFRRRFRRTESTARGLLRIGSAGPVRSDSFDVGGWR